MFEVLIVLALHHILTPGERPSLLLPEDTAGVETFSLFILLCFHSKCRKRIVLFSFSQHQLVTHKKKPETKQSCKLSHSAICGPPQGRNFMRFTHCKSMEPIRADLNLRSLFTNLLSGTKETPFPQILFFRQKPAILRSMYSWVPLPKGAISLIRGRRDKWLPEVPASIPQHMLASRSPQYPLIHTSESAPVLWPTWFPTSFVLFWCCYFLRQGLTV